MSFFKLVRVVFLLTVLFVIVVGNWMTDRRLANWESPVWITVYPIVADGRSGTWDYVAKADTTFYQDINNFLDRESANYGIFLAPVLQFQMASPSESLPPPLPERLSPIAVGLWSLKMRWWAWRMDANDGLVGADIQLFVLYHDKSVGEELEMSVAMRKGRFGLVNAYASKRMNRTNQVVMAHELLHVFGATDKYLMGNLEPEYPFGYAAPQQVPLFPQSKAEIMGGRIPLNSWSSVMPDSLDQCKIGRKTAEEIGFYAQLDR